jgi:hypothetical protein
MPKDYKPAVIHNTLADAFNSFVKGPLKCAMPTQHEFMEAMFQNKKKDDVIDELVEALKAAKGAIFALHGATAWDAYQSSPEMQKINNALTIKH